MADPKTWQDVALAALPVVGTLGGTWLGVKYQSKQARQNNEHARELAREQQAAARQQALDERLEVRRQELVDEAARFMAKARQLQSVAVLLVNEILVWLEDMEADREPQPLRSSERLKELYDSREVSRLRLLVRDRALAEPLDAFAPAASSVLGGVFLMREAVRARDLDRVAQACEQVNTAAMDMEGPLRDFAYAANNLLGVHLAPPEQPALPATDAPAPLPRSA